MSIEKEIERAVKRTIALDKDTPYKSAAEQEKIISDIKSAFNDATFHFENSKSLMLNQSGKKRLVKQYDNLYSPENKEFEPIFIDPSYQHKFCTEVKRKLDNASLVIKNIPNRFIPDCFFETKSLCKTILEEPALSPPESIQKLIQNCMLIESSIAVIAQRFNSRYLRSMYEIEGSADY